MFDLERLPIVEYKEQNQFVDWIYKDELEATLRMRLALGKSLLTGETVDIARFTNHMDTIPRDRLVAILKERIAHLELRLDKFLTKRRLP